MGSFLLLGSVLDHPRVRHVVICPLGKFPLRLPGQLDGCPVCRDFAERRSDLAAVEFQPDYGVRAGASDISTILATASCRDSVSMAHRGFDRTAAAGRSCSCRQHNDAPPAEECAQPSWVICTVTNISDGPPE